MFDAHVQSVSNEFYLKDEVKLMWSIKIIFIYLFIYTKIEEIFRQLILTFRVE